MVPLNKTTYGKKILLFIYDMLVTFLMSILAILLVDKENLTGNFNYVLIYAFFLMAVTIIVFYFFKLYEPANTHPYIIHTLDGLVVGNIMALLGVVCLMVVTCGLPSSVFKSWSVIV